MAKVDGRTKERREVCCLVSEMLEEMGLDSGKARELRRQALVGLMTFCQWQLARMDEGFEGPRTGRAAGSGRSRGRRVKVT